MTKFRRTLGKMAIFAAILGVLIAAYVFWAGQSALEKRIFVAVIVLVLWIIPTIFCAIYFLTEKLVIDHEKIVVKTLFNKKMIMKENTKAIKVVHGDIALRQNDKVCLVPREVPDEIAEGHGDNYMLLIKKDKRILRFSIDSDSKLLLKKYGWKI